MSVDEMHATSVRPFAVISTLVSLAFLSISSMSVAQESDNIVEESPEKVIEEIVTTGSRLKRDSFSSVSPLQVITGQVSREIGLIDPGKILQESTAATGGQIDLTFQGFVLDNGPGSSTLNLRGLGASRSLILVNGRRLAPSGVEGAPSSPDLNLIPGSLVSRYDILLDGASSVYGSDAIAGVTNIILRQDFDGLEIQAYGAVPAQGAYGGGEERSLAVTWGRNGDRGFFGMGVDYRESDPITFADRDWTDQCDRHFEETETSGELRHADLFYPATLGMRSDVCKVQLLMSRFAELSGRFGSVYATPGQSNTGIPNFSEAVLWSVPMDSNQDGINDIDYHDYDLNGHPVTQSAHMFPKNERISAMAYGEYTFSGNANITPYFEAQYNKRETYAFSGTNQFFPVVPASNLYNPCNPGTPGTPSVRGVDCGLAYDAVLTDPTYVENFSDYYSTNFGCFGFAPEDCSPANFGLLGGPAGPTAVQPIVTVQGDRSEVWSEVAQVRAVAGVKGDMPFMNFGGVENWSFDAYYVYADSDGESLRRGINEERLNQSLDVVYSDPGTPDPSSIVCSDPSGGCVPLDLFTEELYANPGYGDIPQDAKDFLFDNREFRTTYTQQIASIYFTGDLWDMPAGDAIGGFGFEYRNDEIQSIPDDVAREGLLWNFFSDEGASGDKDTKEFFGEIELPILAGVAGAEELTVNLSGRYTKDEFYEGHWTHSLKLGWRPIESLMLRATTGTSFRAPNVRETFLESQTGFLSLVDPCVIPEDARDPLGNYDPTLDRREGQVLTNCAAQGVDPTALDNGGISVYGMEIARGGTPELKPETSESLSIGFVWDQPFFDSYDLSFSFSYYDIEVQNEIIEPNGQFIINDCYFDLEGDSTFCGRIDRDSEPGAEFVNFLDGGFINRDSLKTRGMDFNIAYDQTVSWFNRAVDLGVDLAANRMLENSRLFLDDEGNEDFTELTGRFGFPEWNGRVTFRAEIEKYRVTWSTRYMSAVSQDPLFADPYDAVPDGFADTCLGPAAGDENCRDIGYADDYFTHDVSLFYYGDQWTFGGGFRNVFNQAPPLVDTSEVFAVNNTPLGAGYDLIGRMAFLNIQVSFE